MTETLNEDEHGNPFGCVYSLKFAGSNVDHDFVAADSFSRVQLALIATQKELTAAGARTWSANKRAEAAEQALALRGEPVANKAKEFIEEYAMHLIDPCTIYPDGNCACGYTQKLRALYAAPISGEPVAWGLPNTAITGKKQALMMVSLEVPSDDQYGGAMWVPLVLGAAR